MRILFKGAWGWGGGGVFASPKAHLWGAYREASRGDQRNDRQPSTVFRSELSIAGGLLPTIAGLQEASR
jgi:hypothetical protein